MPKNIPVINARHPWQENFLPSNTTHVRISGTLTDGFYRTLLQNLPQICSISLCPSSKRKLSPAVSRDALLRGIAFIVDRTFLTPAKPYERAFGERRRMLKTITGAAKKRFELLLKKGSVEAQALVRYYQLKSGMSRLTLSQLADEFGYSQPGVMSHDVAGVFACIFPQINAPGYVRRIAQKIHERYVDPKMQQLRKKLRKVRARLQVLFDRA